MRGARGEVAGPRGIGTSEISLLIPSGNASCWASTLDTSSSGTRACSAAGTRCQYARAACVKRLWYPHARRTRV